MSAYVSRVTVCRREDAEHARAARSGRHQRPLILIDIAVPRDIDPAARRLAGIFLYDLDDPRSGAEANLRERQKEAAAAEALVDREVREFLEWQKSLDVVPILVALRQRADQSRRPQIRQGRKPLGGLS